MTILTFPLFVAATTATMAPILHYGRVFYAVWAGSGALRLDVLLVAGAAAFLQFLAIGVARVLGLRWVLVALGLAVGLAIALLPPVSLNARQLFESMLD